MKFAVIIFATLLFLSTESIAQANATGTPNYTKETTESTIGCLSGDCINGWGEYQYDNGHYRGFFSNGSRMGYGLYNWDDDDSSYIGNWNSSMNGYGVYIKKNGDNIVGIFENGELEGMGYTLTDGEWKYGIFSSGSLITKYDFYTNSAETGCTAGDCENKYGKYEWSNGDVFIGFFKNGNMVLGNYTFADGNKYTGQFNNNSEFHGVGRYFYSSGGYYGGRWENGKLNGKGYYHNEDLVQQIGVWKDGTLLESYKD